jgi:hypothetical protein
MPQTTKSTATKIEIAVYRCVAKCKGGSDIHRKIIQLLEERFESKNQVTRIMTGTASIDNEDLKTIKSVLIEFDSTITIDDLI